MKLRKNYLLSIILLICGFAVSALAENPPILHSVVIDDGNVQVEYSKDFETCAHLYRTSPYQITHTHNLFCTSGDHVVEINPLSEFHDIAVGDEVVLKHGNLSLFSDPVTVTCASNIYFVDDDAPADGDGSNWAAAFDDLQEALDTAVSGDQIWVAAGIYTPTYDYGTGDGNPRYNHFRIKNGVAIYGGFKGTETALDQRNIQANETILSGDLIGNDDPDIPIEELQDDPSRAENCYHVIYHPEGHILDISTVIDGVTIYAGNANGNTTTPGNGGGMFNGRNSDPMVINCTFSSNSAKFSGGGMWNYAGSPTMVNCTFIGNTANDGGGMDNFGGKATVSKCTYIFNVSTYGGGGISNNSSSLILTDCIFNRNIAGSGGGGMLNDECKPIIENCTFTNNVALYAGGMYNTGNPFDPIGPYITNCIFNGNTAKTGGGVTNNIGCNPKLINCIFSGNSADENGGAMKNIDRCNPEVTNCTFVSNSANSGCAMFNNKSSNPKITNCIFWSHQARLFLNWYSSTPVMTFSNIEGCLEGGIWDTSLGSNGGGNIDSEPLFVRMPDDGSDGWGDDPTTPDFDESSNDDYGDLRLQACSPCIDAGDNSAATKTTDFDGGLRIIDGDSDSTEIVDMGAYEKTPKVIFVDDDAPADGDGSNWDNAFNNLQEALDTAVSGDQIWVAAGTYYPSRLRELGASMREKCFQMINNVAIYGGFNGTETTLSQRNIQTNETILSGDLKKDDESGGDNSDNCYHVIYNPYETILESSAILDGFTITGGNADGPGIHRCGGALLNIKDSSPTVTNCTFRANTASECGGGILNDKSDPTFTNCIFSGNESFKDGGAMYNGGSSPVIYNCTFTNNFADFGGAIYNLYHSNPIISNCILYNNIASVSENEIYNRSSTPIIACSDIAGCLDGGTWNAPLGTDGGGNMDIHPLFIDADGPDDVIGTDDDNLELQPGSPCIDAADGDVALDIDFLGNPRHDDPGMDNMGVGSLDYVDMGAYEYQGTTGMSDSLTVITPVCGEVLVKGQTCQIEWATADPSPTVRIMLFKGNRKVKVIHKSAPNNGTFSWGIPARLPNGVNYRIKVICSDDTTVFGFSDTFEICRFGDLYAPIEVSDPNSNSVWYIGQEYPIQWAGGQGPEDGLGAEVRILLYKGRKIVKVISALTINDGLEMWTVPSNLKPGKNYRVKVCSADYGYVMNQSPAFTVAIPPLNVTSPTSSAEWKPGSSYEICWTGGKPHKPVSIMLMKAGRKVRMIARRTANDGTFNWQVPSDLTPGNNYQVKVANGPSAALKDLSPSFSISIVE